MGKKMYSRVNYTIVGIFVLLFGTALAGFTFWLAKYGMQDEYTLYKLYMKESVSGLSKDSTVRLHGVDVGRVSEIRIDPNNVEQIEVLLKIRSSVPLKKDMVAHTEMLGITGLLAIEISGGTNRSEPLKASEGNIPVIPTAPSWFSKTTKGIGSLAEKLDTLLTRGETLLSDENIKRFGVILENTAQMTAKSVGTLDEFNATVAVYRKAVVKLTHDIHKAGTDFSMLTEQTLPVLDTLQKATEDFNRFTLEAEKSLKRGDYNIQETLRPMLSEISILTGQLTELARELQQNPGSLLFKSRKRRRGPGE